MLKSIAEELVQINHEDEVLHKKLFDVHMGFYSRNNVYRKIILTMITHMQDLMSKKKFRDYGALRGVSGANIGIPFNIIAFRNNRDAIIVMINPKINNKSEKTKTVSSNCGSILLEKPIKVKRHIDIEISYYTISGDFVDNEKFSEGEAFTIQHEINHNNGILITDEVFE